MIGTSPEALPACRGRTPDMRPTIRSLVIAAGLIGLAASLGSLYVHTRLLADPGYSSFCDVSASISCTQAYLSPYGSVFGVPVALPGALWFSFVLLLAFVERAGPPSLREAVPSYLFVSSVVATVVVLYLGVAAFFVLRVACLLCLTTYAVVVALLTLSGLAMNVPMTTLHRRVFGDLCAVGARPAVLLVVVLFLAGAASAVAFFPSEAALRAGAGQRAAPAVSPELKAEFERWWDAQPRVPLPVSADGARVVVLKFSDLQCPSCSISYFAMQPILARFQAQYPGAVKMVTKDYPLQPDCNSSVQRPIHLAACDAAAAVRMARQQGKGDALEEWFYANQAAISPSSVRQAAASVGAVMDFDKGLASAMTAVKTDVGLGQFLGVHSTPTYFINGVRCEAQGQPLTPQFLDIAIARELQKAGAAK
jgi:uncharacterized membrane protein/protein-disulfide isomerase